MRPLFLALCLTAAASAQDWQLVWSDEFDVDGAPDASKWTFETGGHGWGNNELQHYTGRLDNARVEDGVLVIEAKKEDYQGNAYTSARLNSAASWTYGRYEVRAQLPAGRGTWPAIWMLYSTNGYGNGSWPDNGEIDIMEHVGYQPNVVHSTVHTKAFNHAIGTQRGASTTVPTATTAFHEYAVEWEPNEIRGYVDDELYFTFENRDGYSWEQWPFDRDFHLLLNVAVGGDWGGSQGVDDSVFPQAMRVDYVRVYQEANAAPQVELDDLGGTVEAGSTVTLAASASDAGGVETVTFYQGDGVLGTDAEAPYALGVAGVADGCYELSARATDAAGYVGRSAPVALTVGEGCPDGATWPYLLRPAAIPGTIEAEYYDLGGAGAAYRDLTSENSGGGLRLDEGVDIRESSDTGGGADVTDLTAREWLVYTVDVAQAGSYRFIGRTASVTGGELRLSLDGEDLFGDIRVDPSGGATEYRNTLLGTTDLPAGRHVLRLDARSAGVSLNWLQASYLGATASEAGPDGRPGLRVGPNPAAGRAAAALDLPGAGPIRLSIVDAMGRTVRVAAERGLPAGEHVVEVDLDGLAAGTYVVRLEAEGAVVSRPLVVAR